MRELSIARLCLSSVLTSAPFAAALLTPTSASAQEEAAVTNDIIVTAQRREERLQNVPIAITALSADALAEQGITDLGDLSTAVPNLTVSVYPTSSDTLALTMRGQGVTDPGQLTRDGGVGLYVDGFYIGRPQGALLDLGEPERIEVLRGPQGTLYGRNTTGGAINIISKKPTGEWGGSASFSYGSRNLVRSVASVDVAAIGNLAIRGSIVYMNQDGWVKNPGSRNDFNEFGQVAGRIAARWTPSESLTVDYSYDQGRVNTTMPYYVNTGLIGVIPGYDADPDRTFAPLDINDTVTKFVDHQLTVQYEATDNVTLRSLSAYRGFNVRNPTNFGFSITDPAFPLSFTGLNTLNTKQYSQEFQLLVNFSDRLDFTGGLYYFREKGRQGNLSNISSPFFPFAFSSDYRINALSQSYAAYAQSTWTPPVFDDKLKLTVGGRYTRDKRSATRDFLSSDQALVNGPLILLENDVSNRQKFSNFSPMANVAFQFTPDIMAYGRFSKGYKAGGSAARSPNFTQTYGPEKVTAFEAGLKTQLFDRKLTFNLTGFYNKFDDLQLDIVLDPNNPAVGATFNAGKAKIKGIEIESVFQPVRDLTLRGTFAYMKADVTRVDVVPGSVFDGPFDLDDNVAGLFTTTFVPKYGWAVGGDWTFLRFGDDELSVHGTYSYQSPVYATNAAGPDVPGRDFNRTDAVKNLDARIAWKHPIPAGNAITVSLFADNLLNERYRAHVVGQGGTNLTGYTSVSAAYNEPRTIGGEVKIQF